MNTLKQMSSFENRPYAAMSRVAARQQRLAMHIHSRGFHGLSEFEAARLRGLMGRVARVVKPRVLRPARNPVGPPSPEARRARHASAVANRRQAIRGQKGLSDFYNNDTLAGSYDGLGAAYGNRVREKAKHRKPMTREERTFMHQQNVQRHALKRDEHNAQQKARWGQHGIVAVRPKHMRKARRPIAPAAPMAVAAGNPTLGDESFEGLGKVKFTAFKNLAKKAKGGVRSVKSVAAVTKYAVGFKHGAKASVAKKGKILQKVAIVTAAVAAAAFGGSAIIGALAKGGGLVAKGAGAAAKFGLSKGGAAAKFGLSKGEAAKSLWTKARQTFGLKPLTLGRLIKGSPQEAAVAEETAAADRAAAAVEHGTMTQEQAEEYVANAVREAEARARAAEAAVAQIEAERLWRQQAAESAGGEHAPAPTAPAPGGEDKPPAQAGFGGAGLAGLAAAALVIFLAAGSKGKASPSKAAR